MNEMKQQIPNFITLLNLFFGCMAIMSAFQAGTTASIDEMSGVIIQIPEPIFYASLYIGLAGLMDFFDGFAARILKVSSEMGKQLDSLADVVSFGVAPAFIVMQFLRLALAKEVDALSNNSIWIFAAFLIPMAGAYRLARFNIDKEQTTYFKGVPIPMIGILTAAFPLIYWQAQASVFTKWMLSPVFWYVYIIVVSALMVMKIPMLALKGLAKKKQLLLPLLLVVLEILVSAVFFKWLAIPFGFIGYCLVSLFYKKSIIQ
jgi:CDP-diacylglycerol--serine O-phosphatidyltransferase